MRNAHKHINFGWQIARQMGGLDVGQSITVRDRTVLGVEEMGTVFRHSFPLRRSDFDGAYHRLADARTKPVDVVGSGRHLESSGGLVFGAAAGHSLGKSILWVRSLAGMHEGSEEILAMGLIAIVYGVAVLINTYAFVAVFSAAVSLRRIEFVSLKQSKTKSLSEQQDANSASTAQDEPTDVTYLREQTAVGSALEKIAQVFLVVVVGVLLTTERFLYWQFWAFAFAMLFVVRPLAVIATLHTSSINPTQRYLIAWIGVRGIGTIYYLSHAISLGVDNSLNEEIAILIGCCLATIMLSILLHGTSDTPLMRWYTAREEV